MPRTTGRGINKRHSGFIGQDNPPTFVSRNDLSGGENNRLAATVIGENQATQLQNIDISVPGERKKRPGLTLIEDLSDDPIDALFSFDPAGGTKKLYAIHGTKLQYWTGSGSFAAAIKSDLTADDDFGFTKAFETGEGHVVLLNTSTDGPFRFNQSDTEEDLDPGSDVTANTSPPVTPIMALSRNGRVWALKDDLLYFSDASPSDFGIAWDRTSNAFRIPCGEERVLLDTRDLGLIVGGKDSIWSLSASITPAPTSDKPIKLIEKGIAARQTFVSAGDDYLYLSFDGVRGLKRSVNDNLQFARSEPLSWALKDELDLVNWNAIGKARAIFFDNKYFLALPTSSSTTNNRVWVYWPSLKAWMIIPDWNVGAWATFEVSGEEKLYCGDATDGSVYEAWRGDTDNGTSYTLTEVGREENLGNPLVKKVGGEVKVTATSSGNNTITVFASFDNSEFTRLGTMTLTNDLVTFPTTFPVIFSEGAKAFKKFHLDEYGPWYTIKLKFTSSDDDEDVKILEHSIVTYMEEYISEEEQ